MDFNLLFQLIVNGLILGMYYSLLAVPLFLIFATTRILLLSLGGALVIITYSFYALSQQAHLSILCATLINVFIGLLVILGLLLTVHYPLYKLRATPDTHLIASLATLIIISNLVYAVSGSDLRLISAGHIFSILDIVFKPVHVVLASMVLLLLFIHRLMRHSWFVRTVAASASNLDLILLLGVNYRKLVFIALLISATLLS